MIRMSLAALLVAYLPGALLYRLPIAQRTRRAELNVEERLFWHVVLSVAWSLVVALALAWMDAYRFERLLVANGAVCALVLLIGRGALRYSGTARPATWTLALPVALVALGLAQFLPTSEYIIGGKDPGTYLNEGIQIAQRGSLVIHDPVVAQVPAALQTLFFPPNYPAESLRFMGFFVEHVRTGEVVGQLPHLFPASIAIGYGLNGLTGARVAVAAWAILGLVAVYMLGARVVGWPAAFAAAVLLALNVIDLWFGRYPNSEVAMQALGFAALLAFTRAQQDDDRFFGPVAGALAALLIFARLDGVILVGVLGGVLVLSWMATGARPKAGLVLTLGAGVVFGWAYLAGPLRDYAQMPLDYTSALVRRFAWALVLGAVVAIPAVAFVRRRHADRVKRWLPHALALFAALAAAYAYWLRAPEGKLTDYDAYALRTFTTMFVGPWTLVAALAGLAILARRSFWRAPAFPIAVSAFAFMFFYKIRVVPEHFWMERRMLPVVLPGMLLLGAYAAMGGRARPWQGWRRVHTVAGAILVAWVGVHFAAAARPVRNHVEYAGIIPYLEGLAAKLGDRDLVLVESRDTNADTHVFALPLAYIYAKHVLVLASARPDKARLEAFIEQALQSYVRVLFIGGGGTDLMSRRLVATPLADGRTQVPEYASTPWNEYPEGVRRKDFEYSLYDLTIGGARAGGGFSLDVGNRDDLYVLRFNAKETSDGRSIRWTGPTSYVTIPGLAGTERELVLTMHDGGRPGGAPPARVTVRFNGTIIGTIDVRSGFQEYRLALPPDSGPGGRRGRGPGPAHAGVHHLGAAGLPGRDRQPAPGRDGRSRGHSLRCAAFRSTSLASARSSRPPTWPWRRCAGRVGSHRRGRRSSASCCCGSSGSATC